MTTTETPVYIYIMRGYTIEILDVRYSGGGQCWEWRISKDGSKRHQSAEEYGSPEPAARDAFGWLVEND